MLTRKHRRGHVVRRWKSKSWRLQQQRERRSKQWQMPPLPLQCMRVSWLRRSARQKTRKRRLRLPLVKQKQHCRVNAAQLPPALRLKLRHGRQRSGRTRGVLRFSAPWQMHRSRRALHSAKLLNARLMLRKRLACVPQCKTSRLNWLLSVLKLRCEPRNLH